MILHMYEYFWILLLLIDRVSSVYIMNNKTIPEKACDTLPENAGISCIEYVIPYQSYCTEDKLKQLFPDLYINAGPGELPAPVTDLASHGTTQYTWGAPKYGSINFLRGFQVIMIGMDYDTANTKKCSVFDVSDNKKIENLNKLIETTFVMELSGTYAVTVKSLPLATGRYASKQPELVIHSDQRKPVYFPDLSVHVHYNQLNASAINVSIDITPVVGNLTSMDVKIASNGSFIPNRVDTFDIAKKYIIINDLDVRNYTLTFTPLDPFVLTPDYGEKCLCHVNDSCIPCLGYTADIYVRQIAETRTTDDGGGPYTTLAFVLAPVLTFGLAVAILFMVCRVFIRNKSLPTCIRSSRLFNKAGRTLTNESDEKRPILHIIYTSDHVHHKTANGCLATLLKKATNYEVVVDSTHIREIQNIGLSDGSLFNSGVSFQGRQFNNADAIVIVHSEWAYKLKTVIEAGDLNIVDISDADDKSFLLCINEIFQQPTLTSKLLSIKFEYTQEHSVIREPFLGPQFNLPHNIDALVKHLNTKTGTNQSEAACANADDKMSMLAAINATFTYQNKHKTWLFTKLFNLKNYSSDDSGIGLSRPRSLRSRSIRSRSADTIPHPVCTCDNPNRQQSCQQHFRKPMVAQRTYSCDLSFYPPESIADEVSERFSLLESRFLRINRHYQNILNNEAGDCDYITLDELSV